MHEHQVYGKYVRQISNRNACSFFIYPSASSAESFSGRLVFLRSHVIVFLAHAVSAHVLVARDAVVHVSRMQILRVALDAGEKVVRLVALAATATAVLRFLFGHRPGLSVL
jgi:hypothetical protein